MNFGNNQFNMGDFNDSLNNQDQQNQYYQQQQQYPGQMMGGYYDPQQQQMQQQFQFPQQMGLGPQISAPGMGAGFNPAQAAPINSQFEEGKAENSGSGLMGTLKVKEFIPKGVVVKTQEQFPDLDDLDDDAPKKKKNKKQKVQAAPVVKEEEDEDLSTPWKGKNSDFFVMAEMKTLPDVPDPNNPFNFELNDAQWDFIYRFYPEYAGSPYQMLSWLFQQVKIQEDMIEAQNALYQQKPVRNNKYQDDEGGLDTYERGFGPQGQKKKKDLKKIDDNARAVKDQKTQDDKEKQGKTDKTEQQIKEQKIMKAFKDRDVNMNPDDLVEVDTTREPVSMVFIGHVDAGKSTICGNLMFMMGVVDARTIERYQKEAKDKGRDSWWLAYVMDVSDDEKAKGKTVEVGRAQFDLPTKKYTIFDAPGHKNYVPNMIMGAALADIGGLVISARKGEFEAGFEKEGQTREHAQLAKSLGVQKLVIIVNKMDDCNWSKARWDEIQEGLIPFLKATGYSEEDCIWVPIAGITGQNIKEPVDPKVCDWYKGKPLLDLLDSVQLMKRYPDGPLRIPVLDKMKEKDLIVHGKVENGTITLGDKLAIMPNGHLAQVMGLLDAKSQPVKYAAPGENVQIKINVADEDHVKRGFVICHREQRMPVTEIFEAEIDVLDLLEYRPIMAKGYTCIMHIHTFNDEIVIKDIVSSSFINEKGERQTTQKPKFVKSQQRMICRVTPKNPIALEKFDSIQQMGRFTLRDEGKTIAVGRVLKYKPYSNSGSSANPSSAEVKKSEEKKLIVDQSAPVKEMVYDAETGELKPAPEKLTAIAEGDEDADE